MAYTPSIPKVNQSGPRPTGYSPSANYGPAPGPSSGNYVPSIPQVNQSGPQPAGYAGWVASASANPGTASWTPQQTAQFQAAFAAQYGPKTTTTNPAPVQPFLTPQQQAALNNWDRNYQYRLSGDNQRLQYAQQDNATGLARDQLSFMQGTNNDTAANAGRGLFQSSIQANDMQDLATTRALRDAVLNTNLARIQTQVSQDLVRAGGDYAATHNQYDQLSVANASAQTPVTPTTTTTSGFTNPGAAAWTPQQTAQFNAAYGAAYGSPKPPPGTNPWGGTAPTIGTQPRSTIMSGQSSGISNTTNWQPPTSGSGVVIPKSGISGVGMSTGSGGSGIPTSGAK